MKFLPNKYQFLDFTKANTGMGMIEVLAAAAIVGLSSVAMMNVVGTGAKINKKLSQEQAARSIEDEIATLTEIAGALMLGGACDKDKAKAKNVITKALNSNKLIQMDELTAAAVGMLPLKDRQDRCSEGVIINNKGFYFCKYLTGGALEGNGTAIIEGVYIYKKHPNWAVPLLANKQWHFIN